MFSYNTNEAKEPGTMKNKNLMAITRKPKSVLKENEQKITTTKKHLKYAVNKIQERTHANLPFKNKPSNTHGQPSCLFSIVSREVKEISKDLSMSAPKLVSIPMLSKIWHQVFKE